MALPALKQLRMLIPDGCGLFVLVPEGQRYLYRSLPMVDCILDLGQIHRSWSLREWRKVRQIRVGVGVLFNNSLRDAFLMRLAGISNLYGAAARGRSILLRRAFGFPSRPDRKPAESHQSNRLLAMVEAMGAPPWDGKMPEFRLLPAVDEINADITALCDHPKLMTIASGAAYGAAKRWPAESFRRVAEYWTGQGGIIVVLGSPSEAGIGAEVVAGLSPSKAYNLSGRTNLAELMQLLKHSAVTVANDSGIMHLSAALGRPGVAVFGPTDYTATGPVSADWRLMYQKAECSPCFKRVCPLGGPCRGIEAITPEMVIEELKSMKF